MARKTDVTKEDQSTKQPSSSLGARLQEPCEIMFPLYPESHIEGHIFTENERLASNLENYANVIEHNIEEERAVDCNFHFRKEDRDWIKANQNLPKTVRNSLSSISQVSKL